MTDENRIPDDPPEHVMEFLPVTRDEWHEMNQQERRELIIETVEQFTEAMKPVKEFFEDVLVPTMNDAARKIGDGMIQGAELIQEQQANGEIDLSEMNAADREQIEGFVSKAKELKEKRKERGKR